MYSDISVCLLVFNHAHVLGDVIQSIQKQTFVNFELIISDDNSTDNSYDVIKRFAERDKRIIPIRTPKNLGMAGNANYAFSFAKNDLVALLHHDDILNENTFEEWTKCILSDENIAFVFNDYKTKESSSTNYYLNNRLNPSNPGRYFLKNILLRQWGCPIRGTALINKKYFDMAGGFNEKFGMLADVDLWMRLSSKWDVGYVNKVLIKVLQERPVNYPNDYTDFSWNRFILLFDIHSSNINVKNYPGSINYFVKRIAFIIKVNFEIVKWHIYALVKINSSIIKSYPEKGYRSEFFITKIIRYIIVFIIH